MNLRNAVVLLTRPEQQAGEIADALMRHGARPIILPTIAIVPAPAEELRPTLQSLPRFDWVVFTSANGVTATLSALDELAIPHASLASRKLAAVGEKTSRLLGTLIRTPDAVPERFTSADLPAAMGAVEGEKVLLCRADIASPELVTDLERHGAMVTDCTVYSIREGIRREDLERCPNLPDPDIIFFSSPSMVRGFCDSIPRAVQQRWLQRAVIAAIGPVTAKEVARLIRPAEINAASHTMSDLIDAVLAYDERRDTRERKP